MSDHQYIEFSVSEENMGGNNCPQMNKKKPSWNLRRLDRKKLAKSLVEARLIRRLNWHRQPTSVKGIVREARQIIVDACNHSMPRRHQTKARKGALYWWSDELARF
ncbi:uncharacterized protein LOC122499980 [Leptopilina heterotoma]|uniref:uncharacterized protein LOC122499980 n=1 Tax=Leptopilina heterotoma TaxID=63436 RepID=UPI001CA7E5D8|nr:uncharacterized protein LOC122499980 [Leptopilina heterotoma]